MESFKPQLYNTSSDAHLPAAASYSNNESESIRPLCGFATHYTGLAQENQDLRRSNWRCWSQRSALFHKINEKERKGYLISATVTVEYGSVNFIWSYIRNVRNSVRSINTFIKFPQLFILPLESDDYEPLPNSTAVLLLRYFISQYGPELSRQ